MNSSSFSPIFQFKKTKFWIGVFIAIGQSLALYLFLNLMLDTIRYCTLDSYIFHILSQLDRFYFNLIFAYFALISGFHLLLQWVIKPPFTLNIHKYGYKRNNWRDHFYLSEIFFYILFSLIIFYAKISFNMQRWFFDVTTDGYVLIFPFLVLFAYFLSIFLIFSKRRLKYRPLFIIGSFLVISIFAFGMANLNIINYKKWDNQFLAKNPQRLCNFHIVKSAVYDDIYFGKHYEFKPIYFYLNPSGAEEIILEKKIIGFEQLGNSLQKYNLENDPSTEHVPIYIDIELKWELYHQLRELLYKNQIKSIFFMIYDPQQIFPFEENYLKVLKYKISDYLFNPMNEETLKSEFQKISNLIQITYIDYQTYQVNGSNMLSDSLHNTLKSMILSDSNYLIQYKFHKDISFGAYFKLFVIMKEVLFELNTLQTIDPNSSELHKSSEDPNRIPFLIYEEVLRK